MPEHGSSKSSLTPVAQLAEQRIPNPQVAGSSPSRRVPDSGDSGDGTTHHKHGLGIYRPGQGYWVRVLTACVVGLLFLVTAAWSAQQMQAVPIPMQSWVLGLRGVTEAPAGTGTVDLMDETPGKGPAAVRIGNATIASYVKEGDAQGNLTIKDPQMVNNHDPVEVGGQAVLIGGNRYTVATAVGVPLFNILYLQAAVAAAILILGVVLTYIFVGVKPRSAEFLIATDGEMKKVHWSTKREVFGSTWVVIAACFLIAGLLWVFDFGFVTVFRSIGLLHK